MTTDRLHGWWCPLTRSSSFTHSSKKIPRTQEEWHRYNYDKKEFYKNILTGDADYDIIARALLDGSLITASNDKRYTIKIIQCGDYYQVYRYNNIRLRKDKSQEKIKNLKNKDYIYTDMLVKIENYENSPSRGVIEQKNINRSKFQLQRLIKANEKEFKTFITLTFSENVSDIKKANEKFRSWRTYIKQLKNDFKYVCVPEFQKRGAVHYHLLTNINYTDFELLSQNEIKIYSSKSKKMQIGRNIKGWNSGYSLVVDMKNINVIGYLSKYMTKDIDNRLFGHRRYFYSSNLIKPNEIYIDLFNDSDFNIIADIVANCNVSYEKSYLDIFGSVVDFVEYKAVIGENSPRANNASCESYNIYYVNLII